MKKGSQTDCPSLPAEFVSYGPPQYYKLIEFSSIALQQMPKGGLEPPRVAPPPPQDGVSTRFHHFGIVILPPRLRANLGELGPPLATTPARNGPKQST